MPTPYQDLESVVDAVIAFLKLNLNTRLTEITTEKGDSLTLTPVPDAAYFLDYIGKEVNFNPFVVVGIEDPEVLDTAGAATLMRYGISVAIIIDDTGGDTEIARRLLRYQRAIRDVFERNWNSVADSIKFEVKSEAPHPIKLLSRENESRIIGVVLQYEAA